MYDDHDPKACDAGVTCLDCLNWSRWQSVETLERQLLGVQTASIEAMDGAWAEGELLSVDALDLANVLDLIRERSK